MNHSNIRINSDGIRKPLKSALWHYGFKLRIKGDKRNEKLLLDSLSAVLSQFPRALSPFIVFSGILLDFHDKTHLNIFSPFLVVSLDNKLSIFIRKPPHLCL